MAFRQCPHFEVVPLGRIDQTAVTIVAANIQAFMDIPVDIAEARPEPEYAFLNSRNQYNAAPILTDLAADNQNGVFRLGLVAGDLCLPIFSYVFGEAQIGGVAAVVSLFRLRQGRGGRNIRVDLFYERLAKVSIHEASHVLGFKHCASSNCIMSFSLGLEQLDSLSLGFCDQCREKLPAAGSQ